MNPQHARAIVSLCPMAAFADARKDNAERKHVRRVAESLGDAASRLDRLTRELGL